MAFARDYGVTPEEYARLSRPFDKAVWRRAAGLAREFRVVMERSDDGYIGYTVEMPGVMGGGRDMRACGEDVLEATTAAIATYLKHGEQPPRPAREGRRDQQLNIRISAEEKLALDGFAAREGFRSVSDYVRAVALRRVG